MNSISLRNASVAAFVVLVVGCGSGGDDATLPNEAESPPVTEAVLVWSDEFDGPRGSAVDGSKWTSLVGGTGWGQLTLDYKTNATDPLALDFTTSNAQLDGAGNLVIRAAREPVPYDTCWYGECEFSSALLVTTTTFQQQYGRFEIRMKTPHGSGLWPSFWLYGTDGTLWGEIDIAEIIGRDPTAIYQAAHGEGFTGSLISIRRTVGDGVIADAYHEYAIEWRPQELVFFVDGQQTRTITPASLPSGVPWPFDSFPVYMILDLAVGSASSWSGGPHIETPFPAELFVDYVRVYDLE